jgi:hypothetical protein
MKHLLFVAAGVTSILLITSVVALSQRPDNVVIEILSFNIGSDYYPILDRKPSLYTADNPDFPRTEVERMGTSSSRRRSVRMEDSRAQGKLRSTIKVISEANRVNVTVRNTEKKTIKAIDWDFAFPRFVDGQIVLRYDVSSNIEIKSNGKKTLKSPLPAGATRCKTIVVDADENQEGKAKVFEAVCGPGVHDPSHLKQETVSIKRIVYMDGSIWQRQREYETNEK